MRNFVASGVTLAVGLVVGPAVAAGSPEPRPAAGEAGALETLDAVLERVHEEQGASGVFLVVDGGQVVYERGFGDDGGSEAAAITPDTRFEVASLAKPMSAVALLTFVEDGVIALDDPVAEHLPGFPFEDVTVRHVLSHTSGLPWHGSFLREHWRADRESTPEALLSALAESGVGLDAEPGTALRYSNLNYWTVARLVESVSGRPFAEVMRERVFGPLEMDATAVRTGELRAETAEGGVAVGEVRNASGAWVRAGDTAETAFVDFLAQTEGDVHVTSTARDVAKLRRVLRGEAVLDAATVGAMTTPVILENGALAAGGGWKPFAVGLGWKLSRPAEVWHDGNWGGFVSFASFEPPANDAFVYLLNRAPADLSVVGEVLAAVDGVLNSGEGAPVED